MVQTEAKATHRNAKVALSRRPWVPVALWCQFFVAEYLVAGSWRGQYSYRNNFISELGVKYCADDSCSMSYPLLNISLILVAIGVAVWARALWRNPLTRSCAVLYFVASIGLTIAGACPTDINWPVHSGGADAFFMFAPIATLSLCVTGWPKLGASRYVITVLTSVSILFFIIYLQGENLGLGTGLVERVMFYGTIVAMGTAVWALDGREPENNLVDR